MSEVQKIIKYCAIAFAVFLAVSIFGVIFLGIGTIGSLIDGEIEGSNDELVVVDIKQNSYTNLDVETGSVNIAVKESDAFRVETNNKYIKVNERGSELNIEEEKHVFTDTDSILVIYIPSGTIFNNVSFESGAGMVNVDSLSSKKVSLDLGAGKIEFDNLVVTSQCDIDGGAGAIVINNGTINNLDLDMGIGKLTMNAEVIGKSDIDAGVGECDITLGGDRNDYSIKVNKGIGNTFIEEKSVSNNKYYGSGSNKILIDGGVGNINIKFAV